MIPTILPSYARAPLSFAKGEGSWLIEEDGRRFLDLGAGIAVNSLGHAHPKLVAVVQEQATKLWHTSNLYNIPSQQALADKLVEHTFADTVFFANSGTEAVECMIKMARKYQSQIGQPERTKIITFDDSFHGRTIAALSAARNSAMTDGFGPMLEGFAKVPRNDLAAVKAEIDEQTAAILVEPVQGEGGINVADDAFLKWLRALCDDNGLLLLMDEVQCGNGRTGRLYAHEWSGVTPDIMSTAKGLGGGFPIGACLATERAASGMGPGSHGSTFGGNPMACAVACAVIETITADGFLDDVNRKAGLFRQKLEGLVASHPDVFEAVRGQGLMLGLVCKSPVMDLVNAGYDAEVLAVPAANNVLRLIPPLTISETEISEGVARLDKAASTVAAQSSSSAKDKS
ncbi:MAG: aspartate aminotransferase family protein [Marinosulfonomonas sp.]|nr:aspartate aminotransferase family protein [Marinosulfonomonas sp.]